MPSPNPVAAALGVYASQVAPAIDARGDRARTPAYHIVGWDEMGDLPGPEYRVEAYLPADALVMLYGPPGVGKSFLAMDLMLSVGSGIPWFGHGVRQGPAVYVAAEGLRGLNVRRLAWASARNDGRGVANFYALRGALPMLERAHVDAFIQSVSDTVDKPIAAVVLDTVSRCMAGGNENQQDDMSLFVAATDAMRRSWDGVTILAVHHPNAQGGQRGSTVLSAAADAILKMTSSDRIATLAVEKQKEDEPAPPLHLRLTPCTGGSCVLERAQAPSPAPRLEAAERENGHKVLNALAQYSDGARYGRWFDASARLGVTSSTFDRYLKEFVKSGRVQKAGELYNVAQNGGGPGGRDD